MILIYSLEGIFPLWHIYDVWNVITAPEFTEWFDAVDEDAQVDIREKVRVLEEFGPRLGRSLVDTIKESRHPNMKELRVQSNGRPFKVFFAFDPKRNAVLLIGADKTGDGRFYKKMIPKADAIFDEYLEDLK